PGTCGWPEKLLQVATGKSLRTSGFSVVSKKPESPPLIASNRCVRNRCAEADRLTCGVDVLERPRAAPTVPSTTRSNATTIHAARRGRGTDCSSSTATRYVRRKGGVRPQPGLRADEQRGLGLAMRGCRTHRPRAPLGELAGREGVGPVEALREVAAHVRDDPAERCAAHTLGDNPE